MAGQTIAGDLSSQVRFEERPFKNKNKCCRRATVVNFPGESHDVSQQTPPSRRFLGCGRRDILSPLRRSAVAATRATSVTKDPAWLVGKANTRNSIPFWIHLYRNRRTEPIRNLIWGPNFELLSYSVCSIDLELSFRRYEDFSHEWWDLRSSPWLVDWTHLLLDLMLDKIYCFRREDRKQGGILIMDLHEFGVLVLRKPNIVR